MRNNLLLTTFTVALMLTSANTYANDIKDTTTAPTQTIENKLEQKPLKQPQKHFKKFEERENKLAKELNLTDQQKEEAKKIKESGHAKIKPLLDKMKELRKQMDELRQENMAEFEKILTNEQLEKFKQIKEDGKKRHFGKHSPKTPSSK